MFRFLSFAVVCAFVVGVGCSSEPEVVPEPPPPSEVVPEPPPPPPSDMLPQGTEEPTPAWVEAGSGLYGAGEEGRFLGVGEDDGLANYNDDRRAHAAAVRLYQAFADKAIADHPWPTRRKIKRNCKQFRSKFKKLGGLTRIVERWTEPKSGVRFALAEIKLSEVLQHVAGMKRLDGKGVAYLQETVPALFDAEVQLASGESAD